MMSLRRRLYWYLVPLIVAALALGAWFGLKSSHPDALWRIVSQQCLPNQQAHNNPAPCAQVDTQAGFVVFRIATGRCNIC
ncbi:CDP-diacylglycerol pyrophosphatase [Serratia plymuthica]|nr:CDP-diacylglycerol pyrophosphatase [Serratia plymuthica]